MRPLLLLFILFLPPRRLTVLCEEGKKNLFFLGISGENLGQSLSPRESYRHLFSASVQVSRQTVALHGDIPFSGSAFCEGCEAEAAEQTERIRVRITDQVEFEG